VTEALTVSKNPPQPVLAALFMALAIGSLAECPGCPDGRGSARGPWGRFMGRWPASARIGRLGRRFSIVSRDPDVGTRIAVAWNPGTPVEVRSVFRATRTSTSGTARSRASGQRPRTRPCSFA